MPTKNLKKIIMSLLVIFTMFFGINVYAEGYGVFVNNFEFDDDNLVVPCGEGTATFEPSTNTLTLNNATITESHDGYALIGNESEGVLNVVVIGTNYFDARDTGYDGFDLIGGGINITGTGTITMDGVMWGTYADQDVSVSISGITLNINSTDQAITSGNGITISNATININNEHLEQPAIETSDGNITITNSIITVNSENICVKMGGTSAGRKFIMNSGKVILNSASSYAIVADNPNNASIEFNGGVLKMNGSSGGTTISNINIADGYAITKGDDPSESSEVEIAASLTIDGAISWIDDNNSGNTRPTGSVYVMVKAPNGTTVAEQEVSAANNWAYSMLVAMNDDNGNPITYTLAIDTVEGYNPLITGTNITMILNGMSTDEVIPVLTTLTKVVASATLKDNEGQTIDTNSLESDYLTGTTTDTVVSNKINEFKNTFNEWADQNDATGNTTLEEITSIYYQSDQVGETTYTSVDDLIQAYENNGGTGILNINKVQTFSIEYVATKRAEREKTTISGMIDWEDSANQDGKRPASVTVYVKNGATTVDSKTVTASDNWQYTFEGLFVTDLDDNPITYSIEGSAVAEYDITVIDNDLVYSHTPETTTISGELTWNDNNNALGLRPQDVVISLYKNGIIEDSQIKADGTYIFANLEKFSNGSLNNYTIEVSSVENYLASISGYNITMNCKKQVISGSVIWNDDDNVNNSRPLELEVTITGNETQTKTLSSATNWAFSVTVDKYDAGNNLINYSVSYPQVDGYNKSTSGYNATYTYSVSTIDVSGSIDWIDGNNRDGLRPSKVTVTLFNGTTAIDSMDVTSSTNWNYSFTGLNQKDGSGNNISYSVSAEPTITGYTYQKDGNNFTYSHTPERISVSGMIEWNDNDDIDGFRPQNVVVLLKNGTLTAGTQTATPEGWTYTFSNVFKYQNGSVINYTIVPESPIAHYSYEQSGNNLIFSHVHETVNITGHVTWNDNNDSDGFRPSTLEVSVYNGTERVRYTETNASNNWEYSFPDLDKLDSEGNEITYTIKANDNLTGYTYSTSGYNIIYTHQTATVNVTGKITWDDNNDALSLRPTGVKITLLANGVEEDDVTITSTDNWQFAFNNLPKYKSGSDIEYTVSSQAFDNYNITSDENNFTYECNKVKVSGQITFEDAENQDGIRPENVTVSIKNGDTTVRDVTTTASDNWKFNELLNKYDGNDSSITYSVSYPDVTDYEKETSGNNVTYTHSPEKTSISGTITFNDNNNQDQIRPSKVTVTLKNGSTTVKTKEVNITGESTDYEITDIYMYSGGSVITYSVTGSSVTDYDVETNGYDITYSHSAATTRVEGKIIWDDNNNQDGYRPGQIEVTLNTGAKKIVTAVDDWEFAFTGLDKYDEGELISYSVSSPDNIDHYSYSKDGYQITYSHTPEKATINGKVIFEDADDQDGIRPSKVILNIDNGTATIEREVNIEGNTTNYSFTDLDKFAGGEEIDYSITGKSISNYTVSKDGNNVTYSHTPDKITVSGKINWSDSNNQDGKRPGSVEITLNTGATTTATPETDWEYEFTDLPKNSSGTAISYSITAPEVTDYTKEVSGNNVTYTHAKETVHVAGLITFDDDNNKYGFRPSSIKVQIKNGSTTVKEVTVKSSDSWAYDEVLDKYSSGTEISYTVTASSVSNYELIDESPNFIYKCTKIKISPKINWSDNDDEAGLRPSAVDVEIYGNNKLVDTIELKSSDNWTKTITVNKYHTDGTTLAYTITPETIDSYTLSTNDLEATYTYSGVAKTKVVGKITWNDSNASSRPSGVVVILNANGTEYTRKTVTASDDWKYSFIGLVKEDDEGAEISYTIDIESVNGYTASIDGNNITLDKINYRIVDGDKQLFVINEDEDATFKVNGDYSLFKDLYIDNILVDKANYTIREGSTIITLKDSFTKTLSSGKHTIRVVYKDGGEASGSFTVQRESTSSSVKELINPTTGDKFVLYILLLISSLLSISVIEIKQRKAN